MPFTITKIARPSSFWQESYVRIQKGQRLVIAVSNPKILKHPNLKLLNKFEWYIHKSLTRNIIILEKD